MTETATALLFYVIFSAGLIDWEAGLRPFTRNRSNDMTGGHMAIGVLDNKIVFKLGSRTLTLDYRKVPFAAWGELKQATGFTQRGLIRALDDLDLDAIVALIWLERRQRERKLRYHEALQELQDSDDEFEVVDMILKGRSINGSEGAQDDTEGEDPTAGSS